MKQQDDSEFSKHGATMTASHPNVACLVGVARA